MTRDEIVTALRCVAVCGGCDCSECESRHIGSGTCVLDQDEYFSAAADLIENQQRHIEALMKANDSLKGAIARRDKQIEDLNKGMAQLAKAVAVKEENDGTTDCTCYTPEEIAKLQGDLIQRNAELLKTREELKEHYDSISQLDGANSSLMAANEKLAADRKALINELCQYCGKYKQAHEGACDGCRWREM